MDFDDTYTRDPEMWNIVIAQMQAAGHKVYCVTARQPSDSLEVYATLGRMVGAENCYFTSMQSKKNYMFSKGIYINVWIDDNPDAIIRGFDIELNNGEIYD
jgi:hydroxymethylpyrimidine pyrophosphatase-like HAD family hydrolase